MFIVGKSFFSETLSKLNIKSIASISFSQINSKITFLLNKIYSLDNLRTWIWTAYLNNSLSYSVELFDGAVTPIGNRLWDASDSFCNFQSENKTELSFSLCVSGSDLTCNAGGL